MKRLILGAVAALVASALVTAARGQEDAPARASESSAAEPPGPPDIIVRGRRIGELRDEIERAEEAVFARFNDINSTDDFDIHCRFQKSGFMRSRACQSNISRLLSGKAGSAVAAAMQGRPSPGLVQLYAAEAARKQRQLNEELLQLASEDAQLEAAIEELTQAQFELLLRRGNLTVSREVSAFSGELPYDAQLMFEVVMGNQPWMHPLRQRTFTIANVFGEIRKLTLDCLEGSRRIDYEIGVDWTVPSGWSSCILHVNAPRQTTFRLFEF